ncbi:MAG: hypothetical protein EX266_08245 [Rhodobacteraceae bacterium]|nr:MAG: hypothetical protein EX266_08245 [Paracoccaceae bacterium]
MADDRVPALLTVLSGSFVSQPLAFAALVDAAEKLDLSVDLADVDVIREAAEVRLAHYFRPQIVARIQELQGPDDTVIVLRPSALTTHPRLPSDESRLRLLGKFAGEVIEPPEMRL